MYQVKVHRGGGGGATYLNVLLLLIVPVSRTIERGGGRLGRRFGAHKSFIK